LQDPEKRDEIHDFETAQYVGPVAACMHIFGVTTYIIQPNIVRLQCHLPDEETISFKSKEELIARTQYGAPITTLTAWFNFNKGVHYKAGEAIYLAEDDLEDQAALRLARTLTYVEFPRYFVYNAMEKVRIHLAYVQVP